MHTKQNIKYRLHGENIVGDNGSQRMADDRNAAVVAYPNVRRRKVWEGGLDCKLFLR